MRADSFAAMTRRWVRSASSNDCRMPLVSPLVMAPRKARERATSPPPRSPSYRWVPSGVVPPAPFQPKAALPPSAMIARPLSPAMPGASA